MVEQFVFPETNNLAADAECQGPGAYLPQLRSIQKNADINVRQRPAVNHLYLILVLYHSQPPTNETGITVEVVNVHFRGVQNSIKLGARIHLWYFLFPSSTSVRTLDQGVSASALKWGFQPPPPPSTS